MSHIRQVTLAHFRGVPGRLSIDFTDPAARARSLLLIGDNGSGKSTLVDGLEFALQGRIGRTGSLRARSVPSALSLNGPAISSVSVLFADNRVVERTIRVDEDGVIHYDHSPNAQFALSPLVIRRADILQFWDTPDEQKQVLFFEYFRPEPGDKIELVPSSAIKELQESLYVTKQERRAVLTQLGSLLDPASLDALTDDLDLEQWITKFVYKGIASDQRQRLKHSGKPLKIPVVQHRLVRKARDLTLHLSELKRDIRNAKKVGKSTTPTPQVIATNRGLISIGDFVTEAFSTISSSASFVEAVSLELGKLSDVSLSINVQLRNGKIISPQKVFSEANLDLLAVLIFVAVAQQAAERGQARILVLDDVLQSFDGATRLRTTEFILARLCNWQFVFTLHDRLWAEQLRSILRRLNHQFTEREIRRWSFDGGPEIVDSLSIPSDGLERALAGGEIYQVCAEAGLLLERLCSHLSYALPISVTRKRYDKYTLGDLWPGVLKGLRRTTIRNSAESVERWVHLRNLLGAHYNEWATSLGRTEAESFGAAVRDLTLKVWCAQCGNWIEPVLHGANRIVGWSCRCGAVTISESPTTAVRTT